MTILMQAYKMIGFVLLLALYLLVSSVGRLFVRRPDRRRFFHANVVSFFCRRGMELLNVKVDAHDVPNDEQHYLLVGNHLGFMDILVLSSVKPTLFVTSVEMRETPGLGLLCEMGGCIFVERRSRMGIRGEMQQIRDVLMEGHNVALYPEGTSGDGSRVLPFKKTLLMAAAGTGVPIKVMVINYMRVNGEPMSERYRDSVYWYGDMTFLDAAVRLFSLRRLDVRLSFHEEMSVQSEEERRAVAEKLQSIVEREFVTLPLSAQSNAEYQPKQV